MSAFGLRSRSPSRFICARLIASGLLCGGVLGAAGCPPAAVKQSTTFGSERRPELLCSREKAERVDVSSWRGGGRPDVARVFVKEAGTGKVVLYCREVDLNGDGKKDMLTYFDASGRREREEQDHDYDGVADVKAIFERGRVVRREVDLNSDGQADLVEYLAADGKVERTEKLAPPPPASKPPADAIPTAKEPVKDPVKDPAKGAGGSSEKPTSSPDRSEKPNSLPPPPAVPSAAPSTAPSAAPANADSSDRPATPQHALPPSLLPTTSRDGAAPPP